MRQQSRAWLLLLVSSAWLLIPGIPRDVRTDGCNLALILAPALAGFSCVRAARGRQGRGSRLSFWLLGAGCLSWALGNAIWTTLVLTNDPTSYVPSPADPFYLALIPLTGAAVLCLPHRARGAISRFRMLCDSLIVAACLLAIGWPLVVLPVVDTGQTSTAIAFAIAYPAGDFALLTLLLPMTLGAAPRWRGMMLQLTLALVLLTAADVADCVADSLGSYSTTSPIMLGWVAAFCAVADFGRRSMNRRPTGSRRPQQTRPRSQVVLAALRHVPVLGAGVTTLVLLLLGRPSDVTIVAVLVVLALSAVRQQLALWENGRLTAELESRVEHRTRELARLAYRDALTGLANRARFAERLAETASAEPVLILLDLDGFKAINDTLGHAAGDDLLVQVSRRLRHVCRSADILARLGGDEFAILCLDIDADEAAGIAERVLAELSQPFQVGHAQARIGGSIGLAGGAGTGGEDLLRHADLAMYAAKSAGRHCIRSFDPAMGRAAERRRTLEEDLRLALDQGQLSLEYQPVVRLADDVIIGAEALLRWHHPELGSVPPCTFIPVAEETGLIVEIGDWVLEQACRDAATWKSQMPATVSFSVGVNLSIHQLQPSFAERVAEVLARTGLPATSLVLEITETVFMDDDRTDPELLQALRRLGLRIILDDFGTGYSSLSYLQRFPVDGLKIDQSFVHRLGDAGGDVIAAAILAIAASMGLSAVGEGIEERAHRDRLVELECPLGQGFGLYRPMPAAAMELLMTGSGTIPVQARSDTTQPV